MQKKTIRCGFVGSGFAAAFHYRALQHVVSAKVEVAGVYSADKAGMESFAKERGIPTFDSLDALIDAADVLHVCTPPVTHAPIAIQILNKGKNAIVEKPFTGYFGDGSEDFCGDTFDREVGLKAALQSCAQVLEAEKHSAGKIFYAENWVYAPPVQKEREIIEKTGAQILWINGEQSHSGSHSLAYGQWKLSGGGSLIGKGCHPLTAALYLKGVEGRTRLGRAIRPVAVSARTHAMTRMDGFVDKGYLKTTYKDTEDFALIHVVFEDGTVADLIANELSLGGTNNWIRVNANNHRTLCNMSHNNTMQTFTPEASIYDDVYVVEKIETKAGWSEIAPDEGWYLGYQHELEAFYKAVAEDAFVESNSQLASDTIATIYAGYLSAQRGGAEVAITNL